MTILLTGALGFIGSNLAADLLNAGHSVLAFDNLSKPSINPTDRIKERSGANWINFKFYRADCTDFNNMSSIIAGNYEIDAIIHLAAVGSVPASFYHPIRTMHNNVMGFANIIELVRTFSIPKFIFASSSSVYGSSFANPKKEGKEGKPLSPYALSKQNNEEMAILLCPHDSNFVGLRFFNVYGPGQSLNGDYSAVIPRFINESNPEVYGDGKTIRDFTYVDDVSDAIIKSIDLKRSAILNVGTGHRTSLNELLAILGKEDHAVYKDARPGDVKESFADTALAESVLAFRAKTDIAAGLFKTKKFYDRCSLQLIKEENQKEA